MPIHTETWEALSNEAEAISEDVSRGGNASAHRRAVDNLGGAVELYAPLVLQATRLPVASAGATTGDIFVTVRKELLAYLAHRALASREIRSVLTTIAGPAGPSVREKLSVIRALCSLVVSLARAYGSPHELKVNVARIVHLVCELARREGGVAGALDIEGSLRSFSVMEPALHLWRQHYREHLLHVVDVCLLGLLLLDACLPRTDETLGQRMAAMTGMSVKVLYGNWYLAALQHDVGYGVDVISEATTRLDYLRASCVRSFQEDIRSAIAGSATDIEDIVSSELPGTEVYGLDHGIVSSLHLRHALEQSIGDPVRRRRFDPACRAVLKHNLTNAPVSFASEPITFLLVLCDELQEWERARVSSHGLASHAMSVTQGGEPGYVESAAILRSLEVHGLRAQQGRFEFTCDHIAFRLLYMGPEIGKYLPQRVCVEKCRNLQRLDPTGAPFHIGLSLLTPYSDQAIPGEHGFEALRSYALRDPQLGLVEFVGGARDGVRIVSISTYVGYEEVSFCLELLNRFPLLPEGQNVDWGRFAEWSLNRSDPRSLGGDGLLRPRD